MVVEDLPKKAVAVMLIVALAVSVVGTWLVLNEATSVSDITVVRKVADGGKVSINVEGSGTGQISKDKANIGINIL